MSDIYDATAQAVIMSTRREDRVKIYSKERRCRYKETDTRCNKLLCAYNESNKYCFAHIIKGTVKDDKKIEDLRRQKLRFNNKKVKESMSKEKIKKKIELINKQIKGVMA